MSFAPEGGESSSATTTVMPMTAAALEGWKTATTQIETLLHPKTLMATFWKRQTRPDGRLLTQTRPTSIQTNIFNNNNKSSSSSSSSNTNIVGSALVRLGGTHVLAAVSLLVGQCTSAKSTLAAASHGDDHAVASVARGGDIVVLVSTPDSSGGGGGGDNNRDGQAASYQCQSFLQRILHETMDLEQLLIDSSSRRSKQASAASRTKSGVGGGSGGPILAFRLQVTVRVLQNHGNMLDAALLASVAALQQTRLPTRLEYDDFGKVVAWDLASSPDACRSLKMPLLPVPLSMGTFEINKRDDFANDDTDGDDSSCATRWIVDPTLAEQDVLQNALTIVVNAREPHEVLAVEFSTTERCSTSRAGLSTTDLGVAVHMATARAQEVASLFNV